MEHVGRGEIQSLRRFQSTVDGSEDEGNGSNTKNVGSLWRLRKIPALQSRKKTEISALQHNIPKSANNLNEQGNIFSLRDHHERMQSC